MLRVMVKRGPQLVQLRKDSDSAVGRIEQLAQAVGASGCICWNARADSSFHLTGNNAEPCVTDWMQAGHGDGIDAGQGGRLRVQTREKCIDSQERSFDFNRHAIGVVADGAGEAFLSCEALEQKGESQRPARRRAR